MKNNGITLVSVIITIVVMLILLGVTVNIAIDESGLIGKAKEVVNKFEEVNKLQEQATTDIEFELYKESLGDNLIDDDIHPEYKAFITVWRTTTENESITLPLVGNIHNFIVDYGDGTGEKEVTSLTDEDAKHIYEKPGEYEVKISGKVGGISTSSSQIISLKQWGVLECSQYYFKNCKNLTGAIPEPTKNSFNNIQYLTFMRMYKLNRTNTREIII